MNAERWQRVKALFFQALDSPETERAALLQQACGEDGDLREHVAALLAAHETPPGRLEGGGARALLAVFEREQESVPAGSRIGPYRVLAEIGRGGMGAVYRAVRDDGAFDQEVALKLVKRGMDTDEVVRRFVHERQILAALAHPHIARLLDGGTTEDGRPYFVMEHIAGRPITLYAEQEGLGVGGRLALFLAVAGAVQFAHQNLVVHRDLKPANILVGADGAPKLLDFGIAKLLDPDRPDPDDPHRAAWTAVAGAPLTPDYASPEQLTGRPVTTATDVYGLGVLLYELLVGASPKVVERELGAGWGERLPSQAAAALARARGQAEPGRLDRRLGRRLAGDLDTILGKALAAEPGARYGTAAELADDVRRHLARLPVRARRPTLAYRLGRTVLRHRLASAAALGLVAFTIAITLQSFELNRQRLRAEATTRFLVGLFKASDPTENRGAEIPVREVLDSGARILLEEPGAQPSWLLRELGGLAADPETRADLLLTIGEVQTNLGLRAEAERSLQKAQGLTRGLSDRARQARALALLGDLYRDDSKLDESRALYEQALGLLRRHGRGRSPEAAAVLNGLGLVSTATGDPERARAELEEALALWREAGKPGRTGAGLTLNNLGLLALEQGDREEAGQRFAEALAVLRPTLGEDHPDSLRVLSNLAALHFRQDDYARARQGFREVLRIKQRVLGPAHPDLARTWSNLATVDLQLGRLADAEAALRRSLALLGGHGQARTEVYADVLGNLAAVVRDRGDLATATRLSEECLGLYRRLLGPDHPKEATVLNGLAHIELAAGRPERAEAAVRRALAIRRKAYGDEHRIMVPSLELLAKTLAAQHRGAEADAATRQADALRRRLGT
jgi:serine/threonine protein kinase/Tfp pilus assembly protein PilF